MNLFSRFSVLSLNLSLRRTHTSRILGNHKRYVCFAVKCQSCYQVLKDCIGQKNTVNLFGSVALKHTSVQMVIQRISHFSCH